MRWLLLIGAAFPLLTLAQWQVAPVFSDHMVLQRQQPIRIWGRGLPGRQVVVRFADENQMAIVGPDSAWRVVLRQQPANAQPQDLVVTIGEDRRVFRDILIGDVWICTGQSNMEWPMQKESHWKEEKKQCNRPLIRFLNPPPAGRNVYGVSYTDSLLHRLNPERFYAWNGWQPCDSNTLFTMSAVGYYFAKRISIEEGVPVGLINLSIGGAPLETFISTRALAQHPAFSSKVKGNWLTNDALPVWIRERGRQNLGQHPSAPGDALGPNHAYKPGFAFDAGILPLQDLPVKGVLVYQGESNAEEPDRVQEYKELFKLLISDYRRLWHDERLPVYWVQLSSMERSLWPLFRNAQRELLDEVKYGGMAVTSDKGLRQDVHPPDKQVVGERLARWALRFTYGRDITPSGPLVASARYRSGKVVVQFKYAEKELLTSDGQPVRGFSLDGKTEVNAFIRGDGVEIPVTGKPACIYYGWAPYSEANLVNPSGLPASTFRLKVK